MASSLTTNPVGKEFHVASVNETRLDPNVTLSIKVTPPKDSINVPTIIIDPATPENNLTVTPAFPSPPTDQEVVHKPESSILVEPSNDTSAKETNSVSLSSPPASQVTSRPSKNQQLLDELKYLLKPTNSLASSDVGVQESQEVNSATHRATQSVESDSNTLERLLIEGLTPDEAKSLGAAERRSIAARGQRSSYNPQFSNRGRASSTPPNFTNRSLSQSVSPTILVTQQEHRTFLDHLSGLVWAFLAAYAFSIIIFVIKTCGIDLIFGFFLQTIVQTLAFAIYTFYKGYNLLEPVEHRMAIIFRGLLIGIGTFTSFLAYYYITLPDLSSIRQSQVILIIIFSIFFLHERITVPRVIACILTIIAIILLIRPTIFGKSSYTELNITDYKTAWIPYSSTSWNYIIGISLALCTAITFSIASIMNKTYFSNQRLHNSVLCFWSALSALIISSILIYVTHFYIEDDQSFPHDWRLFVGIALAVASIFVFIANQKAMKRENSSIVTLIYSTDIILALILQNLFTHVKSDKIIILGCILILTSIVILCIEVLLLEQRKKAVAIKVAKIIGDESNSQNPFISIPSEKSIPV